MDTSNSFPREILPALALAAVENCASLATPFHNVNNQEVNVPPTVTGKVKLQECQESDQTKRKAKFAFRSTDLQIWKQYFVSRNGSEFTDMDPVITQHWSLVVHFPVGDKKTFFFEAVEDKSDGETKGILQALCAECVDYGVFEKARYLGTVNTSPYELLKKAEQVSSNGTKYDGLYNNCQSWVKEFLGRISPNLLNSLIKQISSSDSTRDINLFLTNIAQSTTNSDVNVVKLEECEEEFDETKRDAKFAFRVTESSHQLRSSADGDAESDGIQNWSLVIHFVRGKTNFLFGAWEGENDRLQPGRAEGVNYKVFESARYLGTVFTSPSELLETAKIVPLNGTAYNATSNDCKSWLLAFLTLISPELTFLFEKEILDCNDPR